MDYIMTIKKGQGASKLLIQEHPLQVLPSLASLIGLNEAIVIQQIHYWLLKSDHYHENRYWIYNSIPEWKKQFPFWSERTIRRLLKSLAEDKFIIRSNYNKMGNDKTFWYSIDYDHLNSMCPICPDSAANLSGPLPETTTENTPLGINDPNRVSLGYHNVEENNKKFKDR
jgi:hypothetical protein